MKQINEYIKVIIELIKKIWPSAKILIKTIAPII